MLQNLRKPLYEGVLVRNLAALRSCVFLRSKVFGVSCARRESSLEVADAGRGIKEDLLSELLGWSIVFERHLTWR